MFNGSCLQNQCILFAQIRKTSSLLSASSLDGTILQDSSTSDLLVFFSVTLKLIFLQKVASSLSSVVFWHGFYSRSTVLPAGNKPTNPLRRSSPSCLVRPAPRKSFAFLVDLLKLEWFEAFSMIQKDKGVFLRGSTLLFNAFDFPPVFLVVFTGFSPLFTGFHSGFPARFAQKMPS